MIMIAGMGGRGALERGGKGEWNMDAQDRQDLGKALAKSAKQRKEGRKAGRNTG